MVSELCPNSSFEAHGGDPHEAKRNRSRSEAFGPGEDGMYGVVTDLTGEPRGPESASHRVDASTAYRDVVTVWNAVTGRTANPCKTLCAKLELMGWI